MRLAVIGSRKFNDYRTLCVIIEEMMKYFDIDTIVSGGAKGADSLAEKFANENGITMDVYPADWDKHPRAAGFIRNKEIWDNSDLGVAFWDGKSRGTSHSFDISKKQNKQLFIFDYNINDFYQLEDRTIGHHI